LKIRKKPIRKAIEALIIIFVIFITLCGVGYIFLGVAEVPIQVQEVNNGNLTNMPYQLDNHH